MATKMQNRFKSKVLWGSLLSAIVAFLLGSGLIDLGLSKTITDVIVFVLTVLTSLGILNDPTNPTGF